MSANIKILKKDELKILAEELGLNVPVSAKCIELKNLIEKSDVYQNDIEFTQNLICNILEERNNILEEKKSKLELEKLKLAQLEKELELANIRKESPPNHNVDTENFNYCTENLIKSVKTLTIPVPTKAESFNLFFQSIERAFKTKNVPNDLKSEILLNILGEKVANIMVRLNEEDMSDYEKLKFLILKEFQPTPQECLNRFRYAQKPQNENFVQYASKLSANFDYYCQLRKVNDFKSLCELIVSDKIFGDLNQELKTHVAVKQGESWLKPQDLGRECDIYLSSRGKSRNESFVAKPFQNFDKNFKSEVRNTYKYRNFTNNNPSNVYISGLKKSFKCVLCKANENHNLSECPNFKILSVNERVNIIKENKLCYKCFSSECGTKRCKAKNCFCGKPHHEMIHFPRQSDRIEMSPKPETAIATQCNASISRSSKGAILLLTCSVYVSSANSQSNLNKLTRILCDNGSERSWCTKSLAKSLQLKSKGREKLSVFSFGSQSAVEKIYEVAEIKLTSRYNPKQFIEVEVLITDTITAAPISVPNDDVRKIMYSRKLDLADCGDNNGNIEILIGADVFWQVVDATNCDKIDQNLTCVPTIFGFALQGSQDCYQKNSCRAISANLCTTISDIQVLWDLDSLGIKDKEELSDTDKNIISQFENDLKFVNGRYETDLLWAKKPIELKNNYFLAKRRFNELKEDFCKNEWIANEYKQVINEQENSGIIEECRNMDGYFMPHRAVIKEDRQTTKVRVVFNCSSKSKGNLSLNDCLETGPKLNPNILDMILNFRQFKVGFSADIEKAFLMISISEKDRDYLKFLWYSDKSSEDYKIMRMRRLPFGCRSSSFILSATIKHHIQKFEKTNPKSFEMLNNFLYVDDLYYGGDTVSEAYELSSDAVSILKGGGFNLRKLKSNNQELVKLWKEKNVSNDESDSIDQVQILGLNWNLAQDVLSLDLRSILNSLETMKNNKRCVLQTVAKIFDPLGFINPFLVKLKCLLQELWQRAIDWDQELPEDLRKKWVKWCNEIEKLNEITIPRNCLMNFDKSQEKIEVHVFCDASSSAYGSVVYFRFLDNSGNYSVFYLMSKCRVAPLKKLSLPRLELMSLVIGARVGNYVGNMFKDLIEKMIYWSDSLVALHWVKGSAKRWKQFVANRVLEIQEKTNPSDWNYCPTVENPADLLTRGISAESLVSNKKWWSGPDWLSKKRDAWPRHCFKEVENDLVEPERLKSIVSLSTTKSDDVEDLISKYSSWTKLLRVTAWCFRFVNNLSKENVKHTKFLQSNELNQAQVFIIKYIQNIEFHEEITCLTNKRNLNHKSILISLNPFLDEEGILRVGGRLRHAILPINRKHPIILPKSHLVTELIIRYFHHKYLHGGSQLLISAIRQQFWIINISSAIRNILSKCVVCCRNRSELSRQIMGDLPASRVNPGRVFSKAGIDFAGPFQVKPRKGRGVKAIKTYVCVFICFITKAVHLEIVGDMTANSFIAALKRFISRRGKPDEIYSDCGTNFVGAYRELKAWRSNEVVDYLTNEAIEWKYNPPSAPHFGGLWEAAVKTMKFHMRRVIGAQILTQEEFSTYIIEIEACMNSRPLVATSNDPNDYEAITPSHFLIGTSIKGIPEPDISNEKISLNDRWKMVRQMSQAFWKRWSLEYISQLQQRQKWSRSERNIKENDLVIIKEDHVPPFKWKLARVLKVHEGQDKKVRVVELRTSTGEMKRPIHKLCVLPIDHPITK